MGDILMLLSFRLSMRLWTKSISPARMNLSVPGEQIKRISLKKVRKWAIITQISAMVRTMIASQSRSIADCGRT
jgi:hypothetical protein